jgi:hypothetical protein
LFVYMYEYLNVRNMSQQHLSSSSHERPCGSQYDGNA